MPLGPRWAPRSRGGLSRGCRVSLRSRRVPTARSPPAARAGDRGAGGDKGLGGGCLWRFAGGWDPLRGNCTFQQQLWACQAGRCAQASWQPCHLGVPIHGRGRVSVPSAGPSVPAAPSQPRGGGLWPGSGATARVKSHAAATIPAWSAGLGAGRQHEAGLNTGLRRIGVFALGQGHPY